MRRHGAGTVIGAVLACAAMTCLAACGTSAPPGFRPGGKVAGAAAGQQPIPGLASFPFPADVHFQFDSSLPADPGQAAAVIADDNFQLAYYYAIYSQGRDHRYAAYIGDRLVLASVQETLAREAAVHEGFTGTIRFYHTTVGTAPWPGAQTVRNCVDNSQLRDTDIRTGRIRPGQPGRSHFLESDTLAKRGNGWRVVGTNVTYYPDGQAKECVP